MHDAEDHPVAEIAVIDVGRIVRIFRLVIGSQRGLRLVWDRWPLDVGVEAIGVAYQHGGIANRPGAEEKLFEPAFDAAAFGTDTESVGEDLAADAASAVID